MWCTGSRGIPTDETQIATDLYDGLQAFFAKHEDLQNRPFFITGESYAGKYVPAIGELHATTCCSHLAARLSSTYATFVLLHADKLTIHPFCFKSSAKCVI